MANVKISNLTAASTPLAGTEVLPIVQSGATVKASIANVQTATYSGGTANGVAYLNGSKVLTTGSAVTYNGTTFATTADATISGLTVGKGAGAVATNTAVGASALAANTSGASGVAIGNSALLNNTTASNNTAVGYLAISNNTTGTSNTGFGFAVAGSGSATTGAINNITAIGYAALAKTTGDNNTAVGRLASYNNSSGTNNVSVGDSALFNNTTGSLSTAVGYQAGYSGTSNASYNVYLGSRCGYSATGSQNTFIGDYSGNLITSGEKNTILGRYSGNQGGLDIRTASNYIVLSDGDGNPRQVTDGSGNFIIGGTTTGYTSSLSCYYTPTSGYWINNHSTGTASGTRYLGFGIGTAEVGSITQNGTTGVLYNLTSDYRLKNDQQPLTGAKDFVMALQPKKWQWWDGSGEGVGFVAHEFMEVAKYSGHGEKDAVETIEIKDEDGNVTGTEERPVYQSIQPSSSEVMANLVSLIQEQQALITTLTDRITALETR